MPVHACNSSSTTLALFRGDFLSHSQMERLLLKGKPSAIQFLYYVVAFYLKFLSLATEQNCPQPKVSFNPCWNTQLQSFVCELLCFAFCRGIELFKLQIQMAAEDINVIKYTAPLLFKRNMCINFDAKQKRKPNQTNRYVKQICFVGFKLRSFCCQVCSELQ